MIETFASDGAKLRKFTKADCLAWLNLAQETAWADLAISPAAREMLYNAIQTILENDPQ